MSVMSSFVSNLFTNSWSSCSFQSQTSVQSTVYADPMTWTYQTTGVCCDSVFHRTSLCTDHQAILHIIAGLMIMTSHQTFSGQTKHMSNQIKFGQTNFLYIINGNFIEFAKKWRSGQFSVLIISTVIVGLAQAHHNQPRCLTCWGWSVHLSLATRYISNIV